MYRLAMAYGHGWGVKADGKLALEWILKAANAGSESAMYVLAEAYQETEFKEQQPVALLQAVKPDDEVAVGWFKKAAEAGAAEAFRRVAYAYRSGKGVPKNPAKALEWLKRGAEIDDPMTQGTIMSEIAEMLMKGDGVPKDAKAAVGWLEKAIAKGDKFALLSLGEAYQNGTGVKRDFAKARELLNQVDAGYDRAKQLALQKLTAAEQAVAAAAKALAPYKSTPPPAAPAGWAERTLRAPKGYEMLQPIDVFITLSPHYNIANQLDYLNEMIAAGNTIEEAKALHAVSRLYGDFPRPQDKLIWQGTEVIGKVSLGWMAYVVLVDRGPGEPAQGAGFGVGFTYGAVSKEEAMTEAFRTAQTTLRKHSQAPARYFRIHYGVSARPDWEHYRSNHTFSTHGPDHPALPFGRMINTYKDEQGRVRGSPPQTAEAFPLVVAALCDPANPENRPNATVDKMFRTYYPYWDGRRPIQFNVPEPMMPDPVFEIAEDTPPPKEKPQP